MPDTDAAILTLVLPQDNKLIFFLAHSPDCQFFILFHVASLHTAAEVANESPLARPSDRRS